MRAHNFDFRTDTASLQNYNFDHQIGVSQDQLDKVGKKIENMNDSVSEKLNEIKNKCTNLERKDMSLRRSLRRLVSMKDYPSPASLNALKKEHRLPKNFYNKLNFHSSKDSSEGDEDRRPNRKKLVEYATEVNEDEERIPTPDYDNDGDDSIGRKISAISIESSDDLKGVMEQDETWYRGIIRTLFMLWVFLPLLNHCFNVIHNSAKNMNHHIFLSIFR